MERVGHLPEAQTQESSDGRFLRFHAVDVLFKGGLRFVGQRVEQDTFEIAVEDGDGKGKPRRLNGVLLRGPLAVARELPLSAKSG